MKFVGSFTSGIEGFNCSLFRYGYYWHRILCQYSTRFCFVFFFAKICMLSFSGERMRKEKYRDTGRVEEGGGDEREAQIGQENGTHKGLAPPPFPSTMYRVMVSCIWVRFHHCCTFWMRSHISIRGCIRRSVGPSHTSWISEKWADFEQKKASGTWNYAI